MRLAREVAGLRFPNPVLLASGTAGYGVELTGVADLARLGGLVTKAVSREPRAGNAAPRVAEFAGGMLNSVGLANPGVASVRERELPGLAALRLPGRILVNVVGFTREEYAVVIQRLDDLEQLEIFANQFDTVTAFLAEIGLNGSFSGSELQGQEVEGADDPEEGAVTLSTIHQAKGLEWHTVFLVHVQDDVIPHRMSRTDPEGEDEERRLFYVAVTRAEQLLFMSYPMISETHDFQRIINRPSRFLTKLPDGSYDEAQLEWNDNDW